MKRKPKTITLGAFIQEEMQRKNLSITKYAELVGVTHPIISKFRWHGIKKKFGGKSIGEPSLDFLAKLAKASGIDLCGLIAIIHPDATVTDARAAILVGRISQLPPEKIELFDAFLKGLAFDHLKGDDDDILELPE